ncbi:Retinaldehyde-binding protein 1 [Orchesella cincta]|uniref:Retinaldehyde-binding protein 1 n=1 Tax=Orchesella cincta TaxID=48709 RepID=A0A1D2MGL7_ORCCI|nr:Retinaldehyde-binding protein 1 [Orchesella cincta]
MDTSATTINEWDGIVELRRLIKEFLDSGEGSINVREYISSVIQDDNLLRIYLRGRKYRVKHAWETLKRYAEVRFDEYPEVFPDDIQETASQIKKYGVLAMLKSRDKFGRRIAILNGGKICLIEIVCFMSRFIINRIMRTLEKWNPDEINAELMTKFGVCFFERELFDDDVMTNGIIFIQNCAGMGFRHARMYTLHVMLRLLNVGWYAFPLKVGGVYYINVPSYLVYMLKLVRPFFSKKLKERFIASTREKKFEALHENISPDLLPKCLGGTQEDDDAFDWEFLQFKNDKHV